MHSRKLFFRLNDGENNPLSYQDSTHVFDITIVVLYVKPIHPQLRVGNDVIIKYAIFLLASAFVTTYVEAKSA